MLNGIDYQGETRCQLSWFHLDLSHKRLPKDGVPVAVVSVCPEFLWLHNLSDSAYILSVRPKWPVHCTLDVVQICLEFGPADFH
jgi:hypothetical protein